MVIAEIRNPNETIEVAQRPEDRPEPHTPKTLIGLTLELPGVFEEVPVVTADSVLEGEPKASFFSKASALVWRIGWECAPLLCGILPVSSGEYGHCRKLSTKEKSELKVYLQKR